MNIEKNSFKEKKIILVDFSKVVSPIWISRFLAENLEKYLTISKEKIREIYKKNIWKLVIWEYSIFSILDELEQFLKNDFSRKDLEKQVYKIPKLDKDFLDFLLIIKKEYKIILVSDTNRELGLELRKKLKKYFDEFIFSFEENSKKSQKIFWEKLSNKVNLNNVKLFIDDKEENIILARNFNIDGIIYENLKKNKNEIIKKIFIYNENIILWAWASWIFYWYFLKKKWIKNYSILEKEKDSLWLMRSFKLWNYHDDLWWHALHDKNEIIKKFLEKEWKINHYRQKRKAYIDYKNVFIPFPFQLHLAYLWEKERKECFEDFLKTYVNNKDKKVDNLEEFLKIKFWDWIYKYFLKIYNKKIWKTKLDRISTNWNDRISFENIDIFIKWYLEKNKENHWTNNFVNYPEKKWFQEYINTFFKKIKKIFWIM